MPLRNLDAADLRAIQTVVEAIETLHNETLAENALSIAVVEIVTDEGALIGKVLFDLGIGAWAVEFARK